MHKYFKKISKISVHIRLTFQISWQRTRKIPVEKSGEKENFETHFRPRLGANSSARCNFFSPFLVCISSNRSFKSAVNVLRPAAAEFISFAWRLRILDKRMRFLPYHRTITLDHETTFAHFTLIFRDYFVRLLSNISRYRDRIFPVFSREESELCTRNRKYRSRGSIAVYLCATFLDKPYEPTMTVRTVLSGYVDSQQALIMYTHCGC